MKTLNIYAANYKVLSSEEEKNLIRSYRESFDSEVKELCKQELILSNLRLIYSVINKTTSDLLAREELLSYGVEGVIDAIDKYDLNSEARFSTYAYNWILKRVKEGNRKASWVFDIPEDVYYGYVRFCKVFNDFKEKYGYEPTYYAIEGDESEMMEILCHDQADPMSFGFYKRVVAAYESRYTDSLDKEIDREGNNSITLADTIACKQKDEPYKDYLYEVIENMKTDLKDGELISQVILMKAQGLLGPAIQEKLNIKSRAVYRRLENAGKQYLLNDETLRELYMK